MTSKEQLVKDLRNLEEKCRQDSDLWLHLMRMIELADAGFYHLKS
jgi:hypothetical protein